MRLIHLPCALEPAQQLGVEFCKHKCVGSTGRLPVLLQVIQLAEYRAQLYEYLKSRMAAIAPNLTVSCACRDNNVAVQRPARWEPPYSTHMQPP